MAFVRDALHLVEGFEQLLVAVLQRGRIDRRTRQRGGRADRIGLAHVSALLDGFVEAVVDSLGHSHTLLNLQLDDVGSEQLLPGRNGCGFDIAELLDQRDAVDLHQIDLRTELLSQQLHAAEVVDAFASHLDHLIPVGLGLGRERIVRIHSRRIGDHPVDATIHLVHLILQPLIEGLHLDLHRFQSRNLLLEGCDLAVDLAQKLIHLRIDARELVLDLLGLRASPLEQLAEALITAELVGIVSLRSDEQIAQELADFIEIGAASLLSDLVGHRSHALHVLLAVVAQFFEADRLNDHQGLVGWRRHLHGHDVDDWLNRRCRRLSLAWLSQVELKGW